MSQNEKNNNTEDILIDWPNVASGVYLSRRNAKRHFEDAKFLYHNSKYQSAIPIFILSIEESFKSTELSINFRKRQGITQKSWNNLQQHKHKLTYLPNYVIENVGNMSTEHAQSTAREIGVEDLIKDKEKILNIFKARQFIISQLQFLKERCLYQNWNKEFSAWDDFHYLTLEQKKDLAYYIMKKAEGQLDQLDLSIEFAVCGIRMDGFMIKDLEFPTYNELKHPKDFTTKLDSEPISDYFRFHRGLKIIESLIIKKTFAVIDQILTNSIIDKCIKLVPKDDLDNWYPHPMIKAIYFAMASSHEADKDGMYAGISSDDDQTHTGSARMYCMSTIIRKDRTISINTIMINGKEYVTNDKIIEQILKTELIIDSQPGKTISLEKTHQAFAQINLKIRKLRDNEIVSAIDNAISLVENDKLIRITDKIKKQIKQVTKQNWHEQDPTLRSIIGGAFASHIIQDKNTLIMTEPYDPLEKFKVREMILQILIARNKIKMRTDV